MLPLVTTRFWIALTGQSFLAVLSCCWCFVLLSRFALKPGIVCVALVVLSVRCSEIEP